MPFRRMTLKVVDRCPALTDTLSVCFAVKSVSNAYSAKLEVLASAKEIIDIIAAPFDKQRGEPWPEALPQPFEPRPQSVDVGTAMQEWE
jgi:hypothetical protein